MVARTGRYDGTRFKGHRGVTQGDPLYPTIFNMVVDMVICIWKNLVAGEEAGPYGFGRTVQYMATFFYANDVFLALTRPARIKAVLYVPKELFERVGLHTNLDKTVGMV